MIKRALCVLQPIRILQSLTVPMYNESNKVKEKGRGINLARREVLLYTCKLYNIIGIIDWDFTAFTF